jgi:hypothetical protein
MKLRVAVIAILCVGLFCSFQYLGDQVYAQAKKEAPVKAAPAKAAPAGKAVAVAVPKITVLSPMGTPPPVTVKPMAEPLSTLDGKTIYLVNTGFVNTERLMEEFKKWLQANYPKTTFVDQRAGMSNLPAALKTELKEKADGVIFALGH